MLLVAEPNLANLSKGGVHSREAAVNRTNRIQYGNAVVSRYIQQRLLTLIIWRWSNMEECFVIHKNLLITECEGSWTFFSLRHGYVHSFVSMIQIVSQISAAVWLSNSCFRFRSFCFSNAVCLSVYPSIHPSIHVAIYLSVCLSTYLSIYLSVCLSI
jgi:hypothetical protein